MGGKQVFSLVGYCAGGGEIFHGNVSYSIDSQTSKEMKAKEIHKVSGLTNMAFYENLQTHTQTIVIAMHQRFWKLFDWLQNAIVSDKKVEGKDFEKLKEYIVFLQGWSGKKGNIQSMRDTLQFFSDFVTEGVCVYFTYFAVYKQEKQMLKFKRNCPKETRAAFSFNNNLSADVPYSRMRQVNRIKETIFCYCEKDDICPHRKFTNFHCLKCGDKITGQNLIKQKNMNNHIILSPSSYLTSNKVKFGSYSFYELKQVNNELLLVPDQYGIDRIRVS